MKQSKFLERNHNKPVSPKNKKNVSHNYFNNDHNFTDQHQADIDFLRKNSSKVFARDSFDSNNNSNQVAVESSNTANRSDM